MKHIIIPKPMSIEFNMFGDQSQMFVDAKEQNYIVVDISYETKNYILCSFYPDGKGTFKLDKSEFNYE